MSDGVHTRTRFLKRPPAWRLIVILVAGAILAAFAVGHVRKLRPRELAPDDSAEGLNRAREALALVDSSEFGTSPRGRALLTAAREMERRGSIRFGPDLQVEALYRKEAFRRPVLYIAAPTARGRVLWPSRREIAERIFHESLHVVAGSGQSIEEECDAFCAAEEAAAAVEKRPPRYPVMRDGKTLWQWVREAYPAHRSDPAYRPVGCTVEAFAERVGMSK